MVTAYKGLLKEKEALETSLAALSNSSTSKEAEAKAETSNNAVEENSSTSKTATESEKDEDANHLQTQTLTLMNSLATLSAEKSRMEASFQADKKQLRSQLNQKDEQIKQLEKTMQDNEEKFKIKLDELKAKWICERQEREKETNNQMLMIRELQKLYADERHLKENIEMQLNNFKTQFAQTEGDARVKELQAQLKEAKAQLKQLQTKYSKDYTGESSSSSDLIIKQVQQEMQNLKQQHAVALKNEQQRVQLAEEQQKRQAALHEDRVANLETRLAELSSTVGSYDRLRQKDLESINNLKKQLQEMQGNSNDLTAEQGVNKQSAYKKLSSSSPLDLTALVDEIMSLKKMLITQNALSSHPVDLGKIFQINSDHTQCQEDFNRSQQHLSALKLELSSAEDKLQQQKTHISTLQEKVKVLNRNIDEMELELKQQAERLREALNQEQEKWKSKLTEQENEARCKVNELEQLLQKQRQRSLQLLDEKEQEIKTLQTSFEVFHSVTMPSSLINSTTNTHNAEQNLTSSDAESVDGSNNAPAAQTRKSSIKSKKLSVGENCHMLHYANEIARKDIEIAGLRKAKYAAETSLRKAIHEKVQAQQELSDKIDLLEEQVDR